MPGRKISKANETRLRQALEALGAILQEMDKDDEKETAQTESMREAANLGNWLESRLHLTFTELADTMFGEGRLTREERIGLSSAIGEALTAFNASIQTAAPWLYEREPWKEAPAVAAEADMSEAAIDAEFVPLVERAVRRDGTIAVKLIAPGWGSSGYYPAAVLERDGPKVFTRGLKQYWDHPTAMDEAERPEGSLRDLAAELTTDARYQPDGPEGPGLYADAKVFGPYREAINELAPHIGVSIRAQGLGVAGSAEGRAGRIIQSIQSARSVDFVTEPGAGGKILEMFESARRTVQPTQSQEGESMSKELLDQMEALRQDNARLREAMTLRDAREAAALGLRTVTLPEVTKARLVEQLAANPPVTEAGELDRAALATRLSEAVSTESAYLAQATGYGSGRIVGFGGTVSHANTNPDPANNNVTRLTENFRSLGLSESAAAIAAVGRN